MLHLHKHSSCALLPLVTPPPGFVADAKFSTQTIFPALAYSTAASKVLFLETIVLHAKFLFSGTTISSASRYSFWFCMEACMDCCRLRLLFINFTESSKISIFFFSEHGVIILSISFSWNHSVLICKIYFLLFSRTGCHIQ